ncbi:hypothetical protein [Streptomyces sp. NPDC002851]
MTLPVLASTCLLAVTVCYIVVCAVSPFGNCRKCHGVGRKARITRRGRLKVGKVCRRCRGEGRRIRVGWWLFNRTRRLHHEGTR